MKERKYFHSHHPNRTKQITRVPINLEELEAAKFVIGKRVKDLSDPGFLEPLPLYGAETRDRSMDVQNWYSMLFQRGTLFMDKIYGYLGNEMEYPIKPTALIDDTRRAKTATDEFIWAEMEKKLAAVERRFGPSPGILQEIVKGRKGVLESSFPVDENCPMRDARYQREKFIQDGRVVTNGLMLVGHPAEYQTQQAPMQQQLLKLMLTDERFSGYSRAELIDIIGQSYLYIWFNMRGDVLKGIEYPAFRSNGTVIFEAVR